MKEIIGEKETGTEISGSCSPQWLLKIARRVEEVKVMAICQVFSE